MALKPWDSHEPLEFPINGKTYTVPELDWYDGQKLATLYLGGAADTSSAELFSLAMGPVWDEMLADRAPGQATFRAGMASVTFQIAVLNDQKDALEAATAVWESGISPEAVAAAVTAASQPKASTPSPSTAGAAATRSRASSKTTTSPTARSKKAAQ